MTRLRVQVVTRMYVDVDMEEAPPAQRKGRNWIRYKADIRKKVDDLLEPLCKTPEELIELEPSGFPKGTMLDGSPPLIHEIEIVNESV